jgi:hypothetical protein
MRIPFLSDPSVYAEDHSERVFSCPEADLRIDFWSVKSDGKKVMEGLAFRIGKGYTYRICYK